MITPTLIRQVSASTTRSLKGDFAASFHKTEDDTPLTLVIYQIPDDTAGQIEIKYTISARNVDDTIDVIRGQKTVFFRRDGSTLTVEDTITTFEQTSSDILITAELNVVKESDSVAIQATGILDVDVRWGITTIINYSTAPEIVAP